MTSCGNRATRTALILAPILPGILPSPRAGPEAAEVATRVDDRKARPADAGFVELQRKLEATGAVLLVLGIVIRLRGALVLRQVPHHRDRGEHRSGGSSPL